MLIYSIVLFLHKIERFWYNSDSCNLNIDLYLYYKHFNLFIMNLKTFMKQVKIKIIIFIYMMFH